LWNFLSFTATTAGNFKDFQTKSGGYWYKFPYCSDLFSTTLEGFNINAYRNLVKNLKIS